MPWMFVDTSLALFKRRSFKKSFSSFFFLISRRFKACKCQLFRSRTYLLMITFIYAIQCSGGYRKNQKVATPQKSSDPIKETITFHGCSEILKVVMRSPSEKTIHWNSTDLKTSGYDRYPEQVMANWSKVCYYYDCNDHWHSYSKDNT